MKLVNNFALSLAVLTSAAVARADGEVAADRSTFLSRFGATIGADYDFGTLGNSAIDVPSRTMNALSVEGLVGYRFGRVLIGPDFDYRFEGQLSSLGAGNGTNLKGKGWLLGLGGKYDINPSWSVQAAIDFLGKYTFDKQTSSSEDDHLEQPIVIRAKGQYFAFQDIPLSFDLDLQYVSYGKWHVTSADYTSSTNGFLVGAGVTWHFGVRPFQKSVDVNYAGQRAEPGAAAPNVVTKETVAAPPAVVTKEQVSDFKSDLAKVVDVKQTSEGLLINIKGDASFKSSSAELTAESQRNLRKTAEILAKKPNLKVQIQGHSDSSGNTIKNQALSEARAKSVKDLFTAAGLSANNLSASGLGDTKPIESNKTKAGRAANRRVEIRLAD